MSTAPTTTARTTGPAAEGALLTAVDVHKSFGLTQALDGASLTISPASWSPCWAPPAPASPPCCTAWPA